MEIKDILNKLNENFEETINVSMTIDIEGEMVISENNGLFEWEYNGQFESGFKSKNEALIAFKKNMRKQGFRNIKLNVEYI